MKKLLTLTLTAILCCLLTGVAQAQNPNPETKTQPYTDAGSGEWKAPAGTWRVTLLEAWGGGGGGGNATNKTGCGGGGGGAYAKYTTAISITPGSILKYNVGAGGSGGSAGGNSYVTTSNENNAYVNAGGGKSPNNNTNAGANGGTVIKGNGYSGGKGGTGKQGSGFNSASGGGGGGAGTSGAGNPGEDASSKSSAGNGGEAKAEGGGAGGNGVTYSTSGTDGFTYGGGGSGAAGRSLASYSGGQGAKGRVIITYEILTLTVNFNVNYTGGSNPTSQTVLYYDPYGTLPTVTRPNHIFLGWFTAATGGTQVTSSTKCTSTSNPTLYAHWASTGEISGSTEVSPCGDYQVFNTTAADAISGQTITYSWGYKLNGADEVSLDVNKLELTQADLTLDHMGAYVFTRYVNVLGQKVASLGHYTVNVTSVNPGAIKDGTKYMCSASSFTIGSVTDAWTTSTESFVYEWRYSTEEGGNETTIANSNSETYTVVNYSAGTYIFKRYATIGCAVPEAANGVFRVHVMDLPTANYDAPTLTYNQLCSGGSLNAQCDNHQLIANNNSTTPEFIWMIAKGNDNPIHWQDEISNTLSNAVINEIGNYSIYANLKYFGLDDCVVSTNPESFEVKSDPTMDPPSVSSASVCPNNSVTLTAAAIQGGVGDNYTYNWQFLPNGGNENTDWVDIGSAQATYSSLTGPTITAGNFLMTGNVKYRTVINNAQGCDYISDTVKLSIVELSIPFVSEAHNVCPAPRDTAFSAMVTTTDPDYVLLWYADETSTTPIEVPATTNLSKEDTITYFVAQRNPDYCYSARVPVTLTITYTAHLGHDSGDLDQVVCQNSAMDAITFSHSGDCAPQVTFTKDGQDVNQIAGVTVTSGNGTTVIEGSPAEAGSYTFHVKLEPDAQTVCAAPNYFDGTILVNPVYAVTVNQTICGGNYTISDNMGHSYSYNTSGTYTQPLEAVTGCDSVVTLHLYVHEWNQFGFKENEELIAGWTSFNNVASPISADVDGSVSGSQITYTKNSNNWGNDDIANHGDNTPCMLGSGQDITNLSPSSSSPLVPDNGHLLALRNHGSNGSNNGKEIIVETSTSDFGKVRLRFDYGAHRPYFRTLLGTIQTWSNTDYAFTKVNILYSLDRENYRSIHTENIQLQESYVTTSSCEVDLTDESEGAIDNAETIYLKFVFDEGDYSSDCYYNYFFIDNLCISGYKINSLELNGKTEACTNQPLTLMATPPYINTNVTPNVTTPVIYKWERIKDGISTVLEGTSNKLTDENLPLPEGNFKYVVSVGENPCIQSDTLDIHGIKPAYRLDIVRHGTVCSNEVDQVSNITFTDDCQHVDGMFIITPTSDEMRTPGTYTCQLSIPSTENPCDSVITLELEVLKSFDTTITAKICLGETYNQYGFDITPTEEGTTYYTSKEFHPDWQCSTGCDSVFRLTLITSSVRQTLEDETNVTLAAWPMDNSKNNYVPACGVKTIGSSFMVHSGNPAPTFASVSGNNPSGDYCYSAAAKNAALRWPNLSSTPHNFSNNATYDDFSGVYFEIKLNPYDFNNLKMKFDYKRDNASSNNAQAFNRINYYYKFNESDNYTSLGYVNLTEETDWASQTLDFTSANTLDHDVVYLKAEFTGGATGDRQGSFFNGYYYLPSYITVDNVKIWGDRPHRATLNGPAQTCDKTYVCENEEVTFTCQGDDQYFKFYVVNETAGDTTAFNGQPTLTKTPTENSTYKIVAVEQTTMCDSVWGPFNVEVVKQPTIEFTQGKQNLGICGNADINNVIVVKNAKSYTFEWIPDDETPDGITLTNDGAGNITIEGTLANVNSTRYGITVYPDQQKCPSFNTENLIGTITVRTVPTFTQTIGSDTVCKDAQMQFVVDTTNCNFFQINQDERIKWYTNDVVLGNKDTLNYYADETVHSTRHYIEVNQNGCTTLDSVDIVVFNLEGDTLRLNGGHYVMNYGDIYLDADSLKLPDLMHNNEVVPEIMIASITQSGGAKIYPNNMTELTTTITWTITDQCGKEHTKDQTLTFELPPCGEADHFTVTDVDGNTYQTVRMGINCWMRENLKTLNYADGTPVAKAMGYVNNQYPNADNTADIFGRLYSWYSAMNLPEGSTATPTINEFGHIQGVCPDGWFMPTPEYFMALHDIDMDHMRTNTYWLDGGGDNSTDFSMLPAGAYNSDKARFENILGNAYFWTADLSGSTQPKTFIADCNCYMWTVLDSSPNNGFSVRCVKDKEKAN